MAININPGNPLRHVATITSTSNWTAPAGTTVAFVSIHGASGAGGTGGGNINGNTGGQGLIAGAFVQVTPGSTHSLVVGAGGVGGNNGQPGRYNTPSNAGGNTIFDNAVTVVSSSPGGRATARYSVDPVGGAGSATATTSITPGGPGGALPRVTGLVSQQTDGVSGGTGMGSTGTRYANGTGTGGAGNPGFFNIYI